MFHVPPELYFSVDFLYGNLSSSFLLSILSFICLFRPTLSPSVSLFFFVFFFYTCMHTLFSLSVFCFGSISVSLPLTHFSPICPPLFPCRTHNYSIRVLFNSPWLSLSLSVFVCPFVALSLSFCVSLSMWEHSLGPRVSLAFITFKPPSC